MRGPLSYSRDPCKTRRLERSEAESRDLDRIVARFLDSRGSLETTRRGFCRGPSRHARGRDRTFDLSRVKRTHRRSHRGPPLCDPVSPTRGSENSGRRGYPCATPASAAGKALLPRMLPFFPRLVRLTELHHARTRVRTWDLSRVKRSHRRFHKGLTPPVRPRAASVARPGGALPPCSGFGALSSPTNARGRGSNLRPIACEAIASSLSQGPAPVRPRLTYARVGQSPSSLAWFDSLSYIMRAPGFEPGTFRV